MISVIGSIVLIGCASPFFPLKAMDGVDPHFDFAQWRLSPQPIHPQKVQFGGRIVYATSQGDSLVLVVAQLPLVEKPVYRLQDVEQPNGEFVILYPRPVDKKFLEPGNHVLAVGVTSSPIQVSVEKTPISLPTMKGFLPAFLESNSTEGSAFWFSGSWEGIGGRANLLHGDFLISIYGPSPRTVVRPVHTTSYLWSYSRSSSKTRVQNVFPFSFSFYIHEEYCPPHRERCANKGRQGLRSYPVVLSVGK